MHKVVITKCLPYLPLSFPPHSHLRSVAKRQPCHLVSTVAPLNQPRQPLPPPLSLNQQTEAMHQMTTIEDTNFYSAAVIVLREPRCIKSKLNEAQSGWTMQFQSRTAAKKQTPIGQIK